MYKIRMGVPEMAVVWAELSSKADKGLLNKDEQILFRKLVKALSYLRDNPRYPGLKTHEISALSKRMGFKIWQSYLENRKSAAGRIFWTYGPEKHEITILGMEPHPESQKRGAYDRVKLSDVPDSISE